MIERYSRQVLFAEIGRAGQARLMEARVAIIGCGALGTAQAEALARAGVGHLKIVDRDFVEASNLQRQTMYTERDAAQQLPKAVACASHLGAINSAVKTEGIVADVNRSNIETLLADADLVLDGTDNFATRYLINDACVKHRVNWIYGAAVASYGVTMTIRPHVSPCLRCIFEEAPPAGSAPTCDTAGVIMPIISIVAAVQVTEALKLLIGREAALHGALMRFDVWRNEWRRIALDAPRADCRTCADGIYETLRADDMESAAVLCGRDAVQISPPAPTALDLDVLAARLRDAGEVKLNSYLLRFRAGDYELTIFPDARAIIRGTDDLTLARTLYARYVGT